MTLFITNVTDAPLWVPGTIKAPDEDGKAATAAGIGRAGTDQGLLKPGEKVECADEAGARAFARHAGENRVNLTDE